MRSTAFRPFACKKFFLVVWQFCHKNVPTVRINIEVIERVKSILLIKTFANYDAKC